MCGISGMLHFDVYDSDRAINKVKNINLILSHRGPDSGEIYHREMIVFGFRRLAILDLRSTANQPMVSNDNNVVIVFNGEIYNFIEIRIELERNGFLFRTNSDTEVLINAYLFWGTKCVEQFNGMWAFVIYDFDKKILFASRDRLGVKPFYYSISDNYLIFASEIKALIKEEGLNKLNQEKAFNYLAYGFNSEKDGNTFIHNILELKPGYNLTYENGELNTYQFWKLKENMWNFKEDDINKEFTSLIADSLKLRFRSDVPVGFLLSSGLDSSYLAFLCNEFINTGELPKNKISAFTLSFSDFEKDEFEIVNNFSSKLNNFELNKVSINSDNLVNSLDEKIYNFDLPISTFGHLSHSILMEFVAKNGIKVVMNGQGADESFYGYTRNLFGYYLLDKLFTSKSFLNDIKEIKLKNNFTYKVLIFQMLKSICSKNIGSAFKSFFADGNLCYLNSNFIFNNILKTYNYNYKFSLKGSNLKNYSIESIGNIGLPQILQYEDISSMSKSIEIRSPFLDYRLIEFAFSIPEDYKIRNGYSKYIIRKNASLLSNNIAFNTKKIGFESPDSIILSSKKLNPFIETVLNSNVLNNSNIFNKQNLSKNLENITSKNFPVLWRYICFIRWFELNNLNF